MFKTAKYLNLLTIVSIIILFAIFATQQINLHTADLGRHLKNGEIFVNQHIIPKTNYYSYTHQDYPFLNHHWGSGVIFYLIHQLTGFSGLSIFNTLLNLVTFLIFVYLAVKNSSSNLTFPVGIVAILVLSSRSEIRPESLSHLFMALFFLLLFKHKTGMNYKFLWFLPFLQLLWVNTHVYFFLGLFLLGVFGLGSLISRDFKRFKELLLISAFCAIATLLNPAGIKGLIYPLQILDNYGYRVLENQSVIFIDKILTFVPSFYFKIMFLLLFLSWILVFFKDRHRILNFYPELLILSIFISFMAFNAVRNFSIFAFLAIPIISINLKNLDKIKGFERAYPQLITISGFILFLLIVINGTYWTAKVSLSGIGLRENVSAAAEFFIKNELKGPIFNNYDNGGYLTYYLFPKEKVFVDNRPEAYPADFFNAEYIPMQENDQKWQEMLNKYNFNSIFFYRHDATPWAQSFLISRISDADWAPVYVDEYSIIFLKNTPENAEIVNKYRLPQEIFVTTTN